MRSVTRLCAAATASRVVDRMHRCPPLNALHSSKPLRRRAAALGDAVFNAIWAIGSYVDVRRLRLPRRLNQ